MERDICPHCGAEQNNSPVDPALVWMNRAQAAMELGIAHGTLAAWAVQGTGPSYAKVGGRVRYQLAELRRWRQNQLVATA